MAPPPDGELPDTPTPARAGEVQGHNVVQDWVVAWEWTGPLATAGVGTAGILFTWLTGRSARDHAERLVDLTSTAARQAQLDRERRDAYLAALRFCDLELRRARYKQENDIEKLGKLEETFPKGERVRLGSEARALVLTFGNDEACCLVEEWRQVADSDDIDRAAEVFAQLQNLARREVGGVRTTSN